MKFGTWLRLHTCFFFFVRENDITVCDITVCDITVCDITVCDNTGITEAHHHSFHGIGDLLNLIDDPSTPFPEQRGRTYGNVQPAVPKIPVESHDEVTDDITDNNMYFEFNNTGETPVEAQ